MAEPLPCPFCGHVGLDFGEGSTFRWIIAGCGGCGASTGETRIQTFGEGTREEWMGDAKADAITAWNRRAAPIDPQPVAEPSDIKDAERYRAIKARHAYTLVTHLIDKSGGYNSHKAGAQIDAWADAAGIDVAEWAAMSPEQRAAWYADREADLVRKGVAP